VIGEWVGQFFSITANHQLPPPLSDNSKATWFSAMMNIPPIISVDIQSIGGDRRRSLASLWNILAIAKGPYFHITR
jgi:hypothetical protein